MGLGLIFATLHDEVVQFVSHGGITGVKGIRSFLAVHYAMYLPMSEITIPH